MSDFDTLIRAGERSPRVRGAITFLTGVVVALTPEDIIGLTVHEGVSDGQLLGAAISASCSVTLNGAGGAWLYGGEKRGQNPLPGAYVRLSLGLAGTDDARDLCAFYVSAVHLAENDARVTLSGADALSTAFQAPFSDDLTYPKTLSEIASHIAAQAGFTFKGSFPNAAVSIAQKPDWGGLSLRGALGCVACAAASFARVNRAGALEIVPVYDAAAAYSLPAANTLSRVYGEIAFGALAAIVVTPKGKAPAPSDPVFAADGVIATDGNALRVRGNPLLPENAAHTAALAAGMLAALEGMTLTRAQVVWQGDPSLTVGRRVAIVDHEGVETVTTVTRQSLIFDNGFSMATDCTLRSAYDAGAGALVNRQGEISASRLTGEIDGTLIRAGTVAADRLVAGSVTAAHIAAGAIGAEQIKANAVTADKLDAGAVTADKIAVHAITADSAVIADAAVKTAHLDRAAVTSAKIADAAVTTAKIADASIARAHIKSAAIGTAEIETGAITTALIGEGAVETAQIADGSITDAKIVSLTANKLTAGTIDASVIQVNNLTADNITAGTINGQRIPVLGTDKLADGAVTGDKVAENAVTADKIVAEAVTAAKIAAEAVTANKIAANAVTAGKIAANAIQAGHIEAGAVNAAKIADIDGALRIVSGGDLSIQGGALHLKAGAAPGEYLGILSDGDTVIYTGADDANGSNPKFQVSRQGEAKMRDAHVSGEMEVYGEMTFGNGVAVIFLDDAARMNFLRAMANGNALPYGMGGTGATSRAGAMGNLGLIVGTDEPSAITAANTGDRYLLIQPGITTAANAVTPARSGYAREKTSQQRRLKTVTTYTLIGGDSGLMPNNSTTYGAWYDTGTPNYGALSPASAAYCHETNGAASNQYDGTASSTSVSETEDNGTVWCTWRKTTTTTYQYRTFTRTVHSAVLTAPTAGDAGIRSPSVKSANLTITTDAAANGAYSLFLADSADGQTNKTLIGTATGAGTVAFSLLDQIAALRAGQKYLVLERAGGSAAITVTAASLALTYYSGARRTEEYVWNGVAWRALSYGAEYLYNETTAATVAAGADVFSLPIANGAEGERYEIQFIGQPAANTQTRFMLYVNGDTTNANYRSKIVYDTSTISDAPVMAVAYGTQASPPMARATVTVMGGYIFIDGQALWNAQGASFAFSYPASALNRLQVRATAAAGAGCKIKVKRL